MTTVHLLQAFPRSPSTTGGGSGTSWSTSTRTPTTRSTRWSSELVGAPTATCRRPSCASSATPTSRSTRSAAPRIRNILRVRARLPGRATILLEQNYRSTQTILSAANAVIDRNTDRKPKNLWTDAGRRRADRRLCRRHRARRGRLGRRARSTGSPTPSGVQPRRRRRLLPHQRPVPGLRGDLHPASACRTRWSAGCASTSARRSATCWPTCALIANPDDTVSAAPDPQHAPPRHRRPGRGLRRGPVARASGSPSAQALRRADEAPGIAAALGQRDRRLRRADGRAARRSRVGAPPADVLEAVLDAPATSPSWRPSTDPQDEGRVENLQELATVAREYRAGRVAAASGRGRAGRPSPTSWSRSRSSPTPTRSPTTTRTTPAWSR